MRFWKVNGAGNDFIILNNMEERLPVEELPRIARTLCRRRLSLGADGLMAVDAPTDGGDFKMRFYNSDGSVGEMCGNGARCICRYGYETGLSGPEPRIETTAGLVTGVRISPSLYRIRLNSPSVMRLGEKVEIGGVAYPCSYVELGNPGIPHACIPFPGLRETGEDALRELGRAIRWYPAFPKGANVNFYDLTGPDSFFERTFERGVEDFTLACGTGTGSVAAALTLLGEVRGTDVRAEMAGGELRVDVECSGDTVTALYLTGPTNVVAKGEITDGELFPPEE